MSEQQINPFVREDIVQALVADIRAEYEPLTPQEIEFLEAYRKADDEGKRYIRKALKAGAAGLLPEPKDAAAMTQEEAREFLDSLPDLEMPQ